MVFKTAQNVTKHLGYLGNKISYQEIPKLAQSVQTTYKIQPNVLSNVVPGGLLFLRNR